MKILAQFWVVGLQTTLSVDLRSWALPLFILVPWSWKEGEIDIYILCFLFEIYYGYDEEINA